jgi:hypothetical protein
MKFRASPRVCLDHFIGLPDALDAPDWVKQDKPFVEFFQPRGIIAETFVRLSASRINQQKVRRCIARHRADDPILTT